MAHLPADDLEHIMARTSGLWEELRGARLFITGGTGFFGKWLLESLVHACDKLHLGARALVLTRSVAAFRQNAPHLVAHTTLQFHEGDVQSFDFPRGWFTHVIHAATPSSTPINDLQPVEMFDIIAKGTKRVVDFALERGCEKLLFTSSGAVYGRQPVQMTNVCEEHVAPPDPAESPVDLRRAYKQGKDLAEWICRFPIMGRHAVKPKIARCFAFVGPHLPLDAHFAIGNFIRDGLAGGPIRVSGDGTPYRSYLYAADLAIWLWTILLRGQPGRAYNVGSEEGLSIAQVAHKVADYFHTEVQIAQQVDPAKARERYVPSTQRAQSELGLRCWIGLDEAIARTVRWHLAPDNE